MINLILQMYNNLYAYFNDFCHIAEKYLYKILYVAENQGVENEIFFVFIL